MPISLGADLTGVRNLENARSLKNTNLRFVRGWTRDQLKALPNAKDAIIDEDTTTSPSQPPAVPSPPSQSNDAQAPSVPPAQVSTPTPGTGGSNTPSPEPSNGTQAQSALPVQEGRPIADTGGSNAPSSSKPDPES